MRKKEIINEEVADVVNDGSAGIGVSKPSNEDKDMPWYIKLWHWIKKLFGF